MRNLITVGQRLSRTYRTEEYETILTGTSDCNMFVPFYSLFAHNLLIFEEKEMKVLEYNLPGETSPSNYARQYNALFHDLKFLTSPKRYIFSVGGEQHHINMHKGMLYKGETIYLCLGIDTQYLLSTPIEEIRTELDYTKLTLFIGKDFTTEETLKNIRRRVEKDYINPLLESGMDVVYTSRIKDWLFKNNYTQPKFKNVLEMLKHLEEVPKLLIT